MLQEAKATYRVPVESKERKKTSPEFKPMKVEEIRKLVEPAALIVEPIVIGSGKPELEKEEKGKIPIVAAQEARKCGCGRRRKCRCQRMMCRDECCV